MKNHYRYFQRGEKSPWIVIPDDNAEAAALAEGAVRLTVLATNKQLGGIDAEEVPKDVKFYGPLYFDIDNKEDLALAIDSANQLVSRLIEDYSMDPADIQVFLSGSKGLHVLIAPVCFGLERSAVRLPAVYREMAMSLYVMGLDLQVYSLRNAMRIPNVQRDDKRYRIQISVDELREMNPDKYRELVRQPRHDAKLPTPPKRVYTQLSLLYQACVEKAKKGERPVEDKTQVYAPVLKQHFSATELPPCVNAIADGKTNESKSFNQVAMQSAIFFTRLGEDGTGVFKPVISRIADNHTSSQYNSTRARREHLEGAIAYAKGSKYNFSCNAMRGLMRARVCDECPLEATITVETPEDAAKVVGINVRGDGYFDDTGKGPRRLSTFILRPEHVYSQVMEDGQIRRVGTVASVESNGQPVGNVLLDEQSWANKQAFLRALGGLKNLGYFGSEQDLQKLKYVIMSDNDLPEKTMVREMGLHISKHGDKEIRTYVEKGKSFNSLRIRDTFAFDGQSLYDPFLFSTEKVKENDQQARDALRDLFEINEPELMATLIGWSAATHLKPHLMHMYRQFPLINLWGPSGCGKTTTAAYACLLSGVDFITEHEVMNVPISTPYSWLDSLSNSNSVAMIWDEVNRSGDRMPPKYYAKACEMLKACWNGQTANKGALGATQRGPGVVINTYRMSRPTIFCSEQQPDLPALVDRSISYLMTKQGKANRREVLFRLRDNIEGLKRIAFTLMISALNTPSAEVGRMLQEVDKKLPEMGDRPRYSVAVVITGLRWMRQTLDTARLLDADLERMFEEAEAGALENCKNMAAEEASRQTSTEVDRAMADLLEIIDQGVQFAQEIPGTPPPLLRQGIHFEIHHRAGQSILFLDARNAHSAYMQHMRRKGTPVILDEVQVFIKLALLEDYVTGFNRDPNVLENRHYLRIDLRKAEKRGLPISLLGKAGAYEEF